MSAELEARRLEAEIAKLELEARLARQRFAIETRLKRVEQQLARDQLELQKVQANSTGWKSLLTPTGGVLIAASLGLIGTAAGKWADNTIEQNKQQTTIILKASEVPTTLSIEQQDVQRARNLLWFANAGYVTLPDNYITQLRAAASLSKGQALPPPVIQSQIPTAAASPFGDFTFFRSGMTITSDGKCSQDCSRYRDRMDETAYKHPDTRKSLDPWTIPFIVVPTSTYRQGAVVLGDLSVVYNTANGKIAYAIVGDTGPSFMRTGEGSIALARKLGVPTDPPAPQGVRNGIVYVVFPKSRLSAPVTAERIESEGARLFQNWGGEAELKRRIAELPPN
jgi:hypothetical protein